MIYYFTPAAWARSRFANHVVAASFALFICLAPHRAIAIAPTTAGSEPSVKDEFAALQARDMRARRDMSRWLFETAALDEYLTQRATNLLSIRMEHRLAVVIASYRAFLARHPNHTEAASDMDVFRSDITADVEFIHRWEEGRAEDPESPLPWNALAHDLLHTGRTRDAFTCFEKALALTADEAVHFFDYATAIFLYRADAMNHYKLNTQELFSRVLILYRQGMHLEPENYRLAADYAQTFYVLKPARPARGLAAWEHALKVARDDFERDEARTHLARYSIHAGHLNLARIHLEQVTEPQLESVKMSLLRRIGKASKTRQTEPVTPPAPASE